ncbi:MAG: DUF6455 family protein [Pseudodonghicola sp.]|nr:DUF6455 family protein [Pseudodonghicola sp.]
MTAVLGQIMAHVRLIGRMGKATDTDLIGAYEAGDLSQEEWAEMVQTCRSCDWADQCGAWIDRHGSAGEAPEHCPNRCKFKEVQARAAARADREV